MISKWLILALALAAAGCSGEYIMVAPDVAGLSGGVAPVVVRLQRREFWFHAPPEEGHPVTFDLAGGARLAARTDGSGYASVAISMPAKPGKYRVELNHQDTLGDTASGDVFVYSLAADKPILAVDLDSLPRRGDRLHAAAAALARLKRQAQLIYVTQSYSHRPAKAHDVLEGAGYPDGPVLPWRKSVWWRRGPISPVVAMKERMPALLWGVTTSSGGAKAFGGGEVRPLIVGRSSGGVAGAYYFKSWAGVTLSARQPASAPAELPVEPATQPITAPAKRSSRWKINWAPWRKKKP